MPHEQHAMGEDQNTSGVTAEHGAGNDARQRGGFSCNHGVFFAEHARMPRGVPHGASVRIVSTLIDPPPRERADANTGPGAH